MSSEIHGKALTKLIALAAILAFALGLSCIGTEQALASDDNPDLYKAEATVDPPVIGEKPADSCKLSYYKQNGEEITISDEDTSWFVDGSAPQQPFTFEANHKYRFITRTSWLPSACPGVAPGVEVIVNDKPSNVDPAIEHVVPQQQGSMHFIYIYNEWTPQSVTFHSNHDSDQTKIQTVYAEDKTAELDANPFTREGYKFTGWNTQADGKGQGYADGATIDTDASIDLYAQWVAEITVTFNANGGTGNMDPQKMFSGEAAELTPNAFTRDGYTFKGWNTAKDGSGASYADGASASFQDSITLYAQWEAVPVTTHTVTFDANGGTGSMDPLTGDVGAEVALTPNAFTRDGYTFKGWNTKADGSSAAYADKATVKLDSDITLYAQWEAAPAPVVTHTVTFDANGGTGSMDPLTGDEGSEVALTANKFTRDNYTFKGWNTKADGSGTAYADKATVKLDSDITLYAQWSKNAAAATKTASTTKSNSLANTGDTLPVMPIVLVAGVAAVALLVLVLVRRKVR